MALGLLRRRLSGGSNVLCRSRLMTMDYSTMSGGGCVYGDKLVSGMDHGSSKYVYFDINKMGMDRVSRLPYSIRVLLETTARNCDGYMITESDVDSVMNWVETSEKGVDIMYMPSRVILQDFTGVPLVADLAAMRDTVVDKGGEGQRVNPMTPVDLVIDHSIQVDSSRTSESLKHNEKRESERNRERYQFLKWGQNAFKNFKIVPPGSGIVHQVNLEYLAQVVFCKNMGGEHEMLYPDSVVGTDSHTTMIGGLGILGWGVGGIEAEGVMLGQPISIKLPKVIGINITGEYGPNVTATDIVLELTEMLRSKTSCVGKFVEFYGEGIKKLSVADRATISNMAPEYGATIGYFPNDDRSMDYLRETGRDTNKVSLIEKYLKMNSLYNDYASNKTNATCTYTENLVFDLSKVKPCLSGPKRPQDRISLDGVPEDFKKSVISPVGHKGFGLPEGEVDNIVKADGGKTVDDLGHGSIVIAAITSCTNTSNPSVMLSAGLLAKKAVELGLTVRPYIKTSLSPGSRAVTEYYEASGLMEYLNKLGFYTTGYGCQTCIGNSGPLDDAVAAKYEENPGLVLASVLSGNRNFEGRVHPSTKANYLGSPPLVVAYAIAGRINIDFAKEPLGMSSKDGKPVYLNDIWPSHSEVDALISSHVSSKIFSKVYSENVDFYKGSDAWANLARTTNSRYDWDAASTYIRKPPYFDIYHEAAGSEAVLTDARVLLSLSNSVTTDHISPAGTIAMDSPAARYLRENKIERQEFNTYGARRGNDIIMTMGTFGNIRINNFICPRTGPKTINFVTGQDMTIYDAAMAYKKDKVPLIVIAGSEYGNGSSRDWAAKGPYLLGVKCILASSYERIHRSNLVQMGILPLEFIPSETINKPTQIPPHWVLSIPTLNQDIDVGCEVQVTAKAPAQVPSPAYTPDPSYFELPKTDEIRFTVKVRVDTPLEKDYIKQGGILPFVLNNSILK